MSLKSSEINNCSWSISTVLESSFYSSSCCQACFPSSGRPVNRLWELTLKIFFHSPEMNRSIFFSKYFLWVTKKMDHFLRNLVLGERLFPWFNIDPIPSFHGNDSWWRANKFSSLWFCFCLRSACKNPLHSVLTHILRADLLEFLFHCCSNSSQTFLIHEKFWPRSECCLCSKTKSWSQLHIYRANNWLQAQVGCFLGSILSVVMLRLLLEECIHDKPLHEIVWDLQCLSSWNTVHFQQQSETLHPYRIYSICLVVTASQFVLHIVAIEIFDTLGHHNPKELLSWSHWARVRNLIVPSQRVAPFSREGIHTLHISLRLLRKDWAGLQKQSCEK